MIGIDVVEIKRMAKSVAQARFMSRVFSENEREYLLEHDMSIESAAGMFAAKEAVIKALGTGNGAGVMTFDIEVLHDELGRPYVKLGGGAKARLLELGKTNVEISISHDGGYAVAACLIS